MRDVNRTMLEEYAAVVDSDAPWQRRLRLMQATWREERDLPIGMHRTGKEGQERPLTR